LAKQCVLKDLSTFREMHTNSASVHRGQGSRAASPVIALAADVFARAPAGVDLRRCTQHIECLFVDQRRVALSGKWINAVVGLEPEPREILEERSFVLRTTADAIVILDTKQDSAAERANNAPDVDRVHHVPEMEVAGG
jgi:hypothetical protein